MLSSTLMLMMSSAFLLLRLSPGASFPKPLSAEEERARICHEMQEAITDLARGLPRHTVVPYPNIPKKDYPCNLQE